MNKFLRYDKPYVNNTFHIVISYLSTYSLQTAVLSHCAENHFWLAATCREPFLARCNLQRTIFARYNLQRTILYNAEFHKYSLCVFAFGEPDFRTFEFVLYTTNKFLHYPRIGVSMVTWGKSGALIPNMMVWFYNRANNLSI